MSHNIIFWGGTGQALVLRECVNYLGYKLTAIFDNDPKVISPFADVPIYHGRHGFEDWLSLNIDSKDKIKCLVAIGGAHGQQRIEIQNYLESKGLEIIIAVHPTAFVATDTEIGKGSQILNSASVCVGCRINNGCIVNTGAIVDHEVVLSEGVHVAPGANITGKVWVGRYSMIGAGAVVLPKIRIGENVIVGAGSVVVKDVEDGVVVCGNPVKKIRVRAGKRRLPK